MPKVNLPKVPDGDDELSRELALSFVSFARNCTTMPWSKISDLMIDIVREEVELRGHWKCEICGATMRDHIAKALQNGGRAFHNFLPEAFHIER